MKKSFYNFIRGTFGGIVRLIFRIRVVNPEKEPASGSYLICANHTGLSDVIIMVAALRHQKVHFMAKKELFKIPLLSSLIRAIGAFPVDRKGSSVAAIKTAISLVKDGNSVGVFPQGTRCPHVDPRSTEVKSGVGMIAYRAGCAVLPIYLKTKKNKTGLFRRTRCIIGDPITREELGFKEGGSDEYDVAAARIFDRICTLGENDHA
jgi:1-acyl-sn-glycerol-3-phosphate acyltransferase